MRRECVSILGIHARVTVILPYARVAHRLPDGMGKTAWETIRPNLAQIGEAAAWWQVVTGPVPAPKECVSILGIHARVTVILPYARVAHRLPDGMGKTAWETIRPNLAQIGEAAAWWQVVTGPVPAPNLTDEDRAYIAQAAAVLAGLAWSPAVWQMLTGALKQATGRKGKALFLPLRLVLTGREHGPDMAALLALIGREEALRRLG